MKILIGILLVSSIALAKPGVVKKKMPKKIPSICLKKPNLPLCKSLLGSK